MSQQAESKIEELERRILSKETRESLARVRTALGAFISKYPLWPEVVEGSIIEPVTDPARLLEAKEVIE